MQRLRQEISDLLGLEISPTQEAAFATYARELAEWNQRFNLTAIREPEEVRVKHFLDSLSCWLVMRRQPPWRVIDLGSGAGFPGLPLKILQPKMQMALVESVGKKADFLKHMVQVLDLEGVEVLNRRAEDVGRDAAHREQYDWAVARALAPMTVLAEYGLPLVRVGGYLLGQKGASVGEEVEAARGAIALLGGGEVEMVRVEMPGVEEARWLAVVEKVGKTPEKYPRRVGIPAKRPLG